MCLFVQVSVCVQITVSASCDINARIQKEQTLLTLWKFIFAVQDDIFLQTRNVRNVLGFLEGKSFTCSSSLEPLAL